MYVCILLYTDKNQEKDNFLKTNFFQGKISGQFDLSRIQPCLIA